MSHTLQEINLSPPGNNQVWSLSPSLILAAWFDFLLFAIML